ncbi:endoribonuclease MazF [candidate division KSB1 bacterium]|nr:endoribonuclease MazF [candidate division KSB1 bacterium]
MVIKQFYCPDRGDVMWINLNPQAGHEQAGRRPALVLSPKAYNQKIGMSLICPITNQIKGFPFEVEIPTNEKVSGVILSDQVKCLDWKVRKTEFICKLPQEIIIEVLKKLNTLIKI